MIVGVSPLQENLLYPILKENKVFAMVYGNIALIIRLLVSPTWWMGVSLFNVKTLSSLFMIS